MTSISSFFQHQSAQAEMAIKAQIKRLMPAYPKPHLYKRDGAWHCVRHVYADEFLTAQGVNAEQAWIACNLPPKWSRTDLAALLSPSHYPAWAQELGHA